MASAAPTSHLGNLLLVDDDAAFSRVLARALGARGFAVQNVDSLAACTALLAGGYAPDFGLLDLNLTGGSGLKLIEALRRVNADCTIVVLTGYASISTAVDAIKLGAHQYLAKPVEVDAIVRALLQDQEPDADCAPEGTFSVPRMEWEHIQRVLAENGGNISATARALKMHRRTLQRKLLKRPAKG
ncbi:MAG TPA: response regulator [Burkholderiaceae bacterium]|nr:response regulator [Burkholderiaceae bacterium]